MNDSDGTLWLGNCYEYGIEVEKDENKAFIYYQKSTDVNNSYGMYQVGYCYYLGIGVEIDKYKAFTYYLKSAEAGNSMGIYKTAICYYYGIGVEENKNKFDEWIKKDTYYDSDPDIDDPGTHIRESEYGKCAHCNEDNTSEAWCLSCDPDITTRWTSRNKDIDDCMKAFQLRNFAYETTIEWIPFDRLSNVKEIGKGGFGYVYSAIWLDGIRKVDRNDYNYVRMRETSSIVALKTLSLKEFDNIIKCNMFGNKFRIYGLTQNSENKYFMVFQYADSGNLHKFLGKNFQNLTWETKLNLLREIATDLSQIHRAGYIHADFHSGNILQDQHINATLKSYIADLGLSKKSDENDSENGIYGVMPYVAPEVLSGQELTQAADIYGFGVIMSEMSTGQRPFDGYQFNNELAIKIYFGLRPEFAPGTPDCYVKLAQKCMDSDPQKRPTADNLIDKFWEWCDIMRYPDDLDDLDDIDDNDNVMHRFSIEHFCCFMTWCFQIFTSKNKTDEKAVNNNDSKNNADDNIDEDDNDNYADEEVNSENNANDNTDEEEDYNKIKKQFLDADKRIKSLQINLPKNPDIMYTSKMINTKKISMAINASKSINHGEILNSNYYSTKQNLLLISNDF